MKELLRKIELAKEIDLERCDEVFNELMKKLDEVNSLYDELYYEMAKFEDGEEIDFNEIIYEISNHYDDTLGVIDLEEMEKELEEKMPTFENKYDVEKYLNGICYGIEVKELWTYQLYVMDGKLYNENDEDIVKMNLELNGEL